VVENNWPRAMPTTHAHAMDQDSIWSGEGGMFSFKREHGKAYFTSQTFPKASP
jgi:hypothetical protein